MVAILVPGQAGSVDDIDVSQAGFREQIGAIALAVKRMAGSGTFGVGTTVLYVNPEIGQDTWVLGNAPGSPVVSNQQITCGYSEATPFKTLQRALVEAYRLSVIAGVGNDLYDRVVIRCSPGTHTIANGAGIGSPAAWADGFEPTMADLQELNPTTGGVILPRGVSIIGADLRKTVVRPTTVPAAGGNPSTGRRAIFKATGGSFFFNFTFKDAAGVFTSHHLLSAFEFCPTAELLSAYDRWDATLGLNAADSEVRPGETEIVAPYPDGVAQSIVDTTVGASSYVFNCSLRSDYGMCGMFLDGSKVEGFKSMVVAQFTNVTLQKDMQAWQVYSGSAWNVPANYAAYIASDVNNVRARVAGNYNHETGCYDTDYRSFSFKAINGAIMQEVSCFVIGAAIHHWTASGGELTITNSNSNFGMTALLSSGFRGIGTGGGAFSQDSGWQGVAIRRPLRIRQDGTNIRQITLGTVAAYDPVSGEITLSSPLDQAKLGPYTLKQGDFLWIENRRQDTGPGFIPGDIPNSVAIDVRAELAASPWDEGTPDIIAVNPSGSPAVNNIGTIDPAILLGNRVYIRRLVDTRTPDQRITTVEVQNSNFANSRRPQGNFVVRLGSKANVVDQLDPTNNSDELFLVTNVEATGSSETAQGERRFRITMRTGDSATAFSPGDYYRFGEPVSRNGRIFRARRQQVFPAFSAEEWEPSLSMLPSTRGVEAPRSQVGGEIIVDGDLSNDPDSTTLGINLATNVAVQQQQTSSSDYQAIRGFMIAVGYQAGDVETILQPQAAEGDRRWDPSAGSSPTPAGRLNARAPWPLEFNRPSLIRAFGHAYEWAGQGNYSKAMPKYQVTALSDQHKVDFFAVNHLGGRVYNTGFNEDGLLIQGNTVRDLGTNRELSTDIAGLGGLAGDPDIPITVIPNTFERLTVSSNFQSSGDAQINNLTLNGLVDGSPDWAPGALPDATQAIQGIARFATDQETADLAITNAAVTPGTLGKLANEPGGFPQLDVGGLVGLPQLPDVTSKVANSSTTVRGLIETATNTETAGLADSARAVTPSNLGHVRGLAGGFASLDGSALLPLAQLPDVPAAKLPVATDAITGITRYATDGETAAFSLDNAAITPAGIGSTLNQPEGLAQLDVAGKLPAALFPNLSAGLLPTATTTTAGIVELATNAEGQALSSNSVVLTPSVLGAVRGNANGLASLDGTGKLLVAQLPSVPVSVLPNATTVGAGITRYATDAEALAYTVQDAALRPSNLANLFNKANGVLQLTAGNQIPSAYLTAATTTTAGIVELADNSEGLALSSTTRALTPSVLGAVRGSANGLASLVSGTVPLAQIPLLPATKIDLAPTPWVSGNDNLANSTNFTINYVSGNTVALGPLVNAANYLGVSGLIRVENATADTISSINDAMWRPVQNTWVDPQTSNTGLSGDLLIAYYVASATEIIYDVTALS